MAKPDRIIASLVGAIFFLIGVRWIIAPEAAAAALGLPLLDGLARSTEVGDLGAFFLGSGTMILWGTASTNPSWLRGAGLLFAYAAVIRTLAWAIHGADFAAEFIAVEVVVAFALSVIAARLD